MNFIREKNCPRRSNAYRGSGRGILRIGEDVQSRIPEFGESPFRLLPGGKKMGIVDVEGDLVPVVNLICRGDAEPFLQCDRGVGPVVLPIPL